MDIEVIYFIGTVMVLGGFVLGFKIGKEIGENKSKEAVEVLQHIIENREKDDNEYWRRNYEN